MSSPPALDTPVSALFSKRVASRLEFANIRTLDQLLVKTEDDLLIIWRFGPECLDEVIKNLNEWGLSLRSRL